MASALTNLIFLLPMIVGACWFEEIRTSNLRTMDLVKRPKVDYDVLYRLIDYWGMIQLMLAVGYVNALSFSAQTVLMINALLLSGIGQGLSLSIQNNLTAALQCLS